MKTLPIFLLLGMLAFGQGCSKKVVPVKPEPGPGVVDAAIEVRPGILCINQRCSEWPPRRVEPVQPPLDKKAIAEYVAHHCELQVHVDDGIDTSRQLGLNFKNVKPNSWVQVGRFACTY